MAFEYNKICRLCLNSTNTYIANIFHPEYKIFEKIGDLINLEVFSTDPYPKVICTDCYSNLVIFSEFKTICRNSDALLKKYQIKVESADNDPNAGMKGNGKCKSIRNSEEMATRMKECALKKSINFIENMKNFYFLMNQIEEMEGSVINIKEESLVPTVEINIKNEIIYPSEMNEDQQLLAAGVDNTEHKRKKKRAMKRKSIGSNGEIIHQQTTHFTHQPQHQPPQHHQTTQHMEIDESGNLTLTTSSGHHVQISGAGGHHSEHDLGILMAKHNEQTLLSSNALPHIQSGSTQTISIMPQIQYSCTTDGCNETFLTTDSLRQHLWQSHQILFPFSPNSTIDTTQYSQHHLQSVPIQITTQAPLSPQNSTTIQPVTQQYYHHPHKNYHFESPEKIPCLLCGAILKNKDDLFKHMVKHTSTTSTVTSPTTVTSLVMHPCSDCSEMFATDYGLSIHRKQAHTSKDNTTKHHIIINYSCIKCNEHFENETTMKLHLEKYHQIVQQA